MSSSSPNLNLPYLSPSQAQKHVTHNEALKHLDALVQLVVEDHNLSTPPPVAVEGQRFIIALAASAEWSGKDGQIAAYQDGVWKYYAPLVGWQAWSKLSQLLYVFTAEQDWEVATPSPTQAPHFGVNATADNTNKLIVQSPASLFNHDGAGHQLKINKDTGTDTASVLFQSAYSGKAEMGLMGTDSFKIKTSPDGNVFNDALAVSPSGAVSFPNGQHPEMIPARLTIAGGTTHFYGPPSIHTITTGRTNFTMASDTVYFSAFYVDRQTTLTEVTAALYTASSTIGAKIRVGLYEFGTASANGWDAGNRIVDFGALAADIAGHKTFTPSQPVSLQKGWYLFCVGVSGADAKSRFMTWLMPGLMQVLPHGSATSADFRVSGLSRYMHSSGHGANIDTGFPASWPANSLTESRSATYGTCQFILPKWEVWPY